MAMHRLPLMWLLLLLSIVGSPTTADIASTDHDGPLSPAKEPVCPKPSDTLSRAHFPEGFVFGTATAAYQVEGAVYKTSRGRSMWDVHCMKYPTKCNGESGEVAIDFFHRYKEDIQIMKDLNTDAFRMSISWPRIFPYGRKERIVSHEGVKFYHDVIDELLKNGITPFVTIFHWDTPQDLEDEYDGFLSEKIVKDFREYAEYLFEEYGGKVKNWITINEPWVYAHAGYDVGKKAPGRCSNYVKKEGEKTCTGGASGREAYNVTHNLLLSHAEAVEAFRKCEKCAGGKIGIAHSPAWFEPQNETDVKEKEAVDKALKFMLGWHLDPTTYGDYPQDIKDSVGDRLPEFTEEQKAKLKGSTDFVGLNYYTSKFAKRIQTPDGEKITFRQDSGSEWEDVDGKGFAIGGRSTTSVPEMTSAPKGLRSLLKYIKREYDNPEIIIMENGYGDIPKEEAKNITVENGTADYNRRTYLKRHLYNMHQAICEDGVNVKGYFVWSLFDNFEWQDGYKVRFGLYFIDFREGMKLARHEKLSGKYYKEFLSPSKTKSKISKENDDAEL